MKLTGKKVLVVGVGPGLGSATAYLLLKEGASVVIASRNEEKLKSIKVQLAMFGQIDYVAGDASSKEGAAKLVHEAIDKYGSLDHLALVAGNYTDSPIDALTEEQTDGMIDANLKSPLYTLSAALPSLKAGSSVVMVSSVFGTYATGMGNVAYSAAKAGVAKSVEVLAMELAQRGIRVNAVAPRSMSHDFAPGREWKTLRKLGDRACPPEDVASVIVWLFSGESEWVNGAVIPVDGGARR